MIKNKKFSHRDFTGKDLLGINPVELNGTEIIGSCFYQEWIPGDMIPRCFIFPEGMQGVTFIRCNLDNVWVPPGNTLVGCTNKRIKVQNDWEDWILDGEDKPVEPVIATVLRKFHKQVPKPSDLPKERLLMEEVEDKKQIEHLQGQMDEMGIKIEKMQQRANQLRDKKYGD